MAIKYFFICVATSDDFQLVHNTLIKYVWHWYWKHCDPFSGFVTNVSDVDPFTKQATLL